MYLYKIPILLRKGTRILNFRIYLDGIHKVFSFSYVILMRSVLIDCDKNFKKVYIRKNYDAVM